MISGWCLSWSCCVQSIVLRIFLACFLTFSRIHKNNKNRMLRTSCQYQANMAGRCQVPLLWVYGLTTLDFLPLFCSMSIFEYKRYGLESSDN